MLSLGVARPGQQNDAVSVALDATPLVEQSVDKVGESSVAGCPTPVCLCPGEWHCQVVGSDARDERLDRGVGVEAEVRQALAKRFGWADRRMR